MKRKLNALLKLAVKTAKIAKNRISRLLETRGQHRADELRRQWAVARRYDLAPNAVKPVLCSAEDYRAVPQAKEKIDVVIPVYNGLGHLKRLLPSLSANTTQPHRFIVVDDASPDFKVWPFLQEWCGGRTDVLLLRNDENLGFTNTVNRAASFVRSSVFVLLNTDAIVPKNWLERMVAPFARDRRIASTTPFSNSAVFFSFPNFGADHRMEDEKDFLLLDDFFRRVRTSGDESLEFVNGVGFCMGVRTHCWRKYGGFDAEAFGKGYGEECDWCMRVLEAGWKNVLVPNLFVYHNHGGSFNPEAKKKLCEEHSRILQKRWPEFLPIIADFVREDPWAKFRLAVFANLVRPPIDVILIDLDSEVGGACAFRMQQEKKLLSQGKKVATLLYGTNPDTTWRISFPQSDGTGASRINGWSDAEMWISFLEPREIWVNNLAYCHDYRKVLEFFEGVSHKTNFTEYAVFGQPILPSSPATARVKTSMPGLSRLAVRLGTYQRVNECHLRMKFEGVDGKTLVDKLIDCTRLIDNEWLEVEFEPQQDSTGKEYVLSLSSDDADESNTVVPYRLAPEGLLRSDLALCLGYSGQGAANVLIRYAFHDFLSCCPSFFLMDPDARFCDFTACEVCIKDNPNRMFPIEDIAEWRRLWGGFLSRCRVLRFFSENTYRLVSRVYHLDSESVVVKPHEKLVEFADKYVPPPPSSPMVLALVGAWAVPKGCRQVMRLSRILHDKMPDAKIFVYGKVYDQKSTAKNIIWRGGYDLKELPGKLSRDGVCAVLIPSIIPETFSFVTLECMEMGVPTISFRIGASGDRLAKYPKGFIADDFTGDALFEQVVRLEESRRARGQDAHPQVRQGLLQEEPRRLQGPDIRREV